MKLSTIMKTIYWAAFVVLALTATVASAQSSGAEKPVGLTIGTNSMKVAAYRAVEQVVPTVWVTGTAYDQGDMVLYGPNISIDVQNVPSYGTIYMAETAGTSGTNAPVHTEGSVTDLGVIWRVVPTTEWNQKPIERMGLCVINVTTNPVSLSVGSDAESLKGIYLTGFGSSWSPNPMTQEPVFAVSDVTNAAVAVMENSK